MKQLMKVNISANGNADTSPKILQDGLETGYSFTISNNNKELYYTRELRYSNLWLHQLDNKKAGLLLPPKQLTFGTKAHFTPSISPDGKKVAAHWVLQFDTPQSGLWLIDQSSQKLLKKGRLSPEPIVWSDDGRWIYDSVDLSPLRRFDL